MKLSTYTSLVFTQSPFDRILSFCRGYYSEYYRLAYADEPDLQKLGGSEFWNEAAGWGEDFSGSFLKDWRELHAKHPEIYGEVPAHHPLEHCRFWGEARIAQPVDAPGWTVLDFGKRDGLDWALLDHIPFIDRRFAIVMRYMDDGWDSDGERFWAELSVRTPESEIRQVKISWRDVGKTDFRRTFETKGEPLSFENPSIYQNRKIRDRLSPTILRKMIQRLGISPELLIDQKKVEKSVLIAGPIGGTPMPLLEADLELSKATTNAAQKERGLFSVHPYSQ